MRRRKDKHTLIGLDSLVDIVTNNVGILIILAVFMALLAMHEGAGSGENTSSPQEAPPVLVDVPWSHPTHKGPVYFFIRGNRVLALDLRPMFTKLAAHTGKGEQYPLEFTQDEMSIRFFPVTNHVYCLEMVPRPQAGETWLAAQQPGSRWSRFQKEFPRQRFYYFFWVTGDSFELFREIRRQLNAQDVEVGWKPTLPGKPLELCNGFDGSGAFQPQ
ncbi:MAG: hypothetical protein OEV94_05460 [Deltaproteobacteria bacterium]|nr:hypothetical protein [Deltaproteobacteria bacterium]